MISTMPNTPIAANTPTEEQQRKNSFMDHVLEPPSYGWKDAQGQLVIPTSGQMIGEFFARLNVFRNKKNWLTFFSWSRVLLLAICLFIFAFRYFNFYLLGVAF